MKRQALFTAMFLVLMTASLSANYYTSSHQHHKRGKIPSHHHQVPRKIPRAFVYHNIGILASMEGDPLVDWRDGFTGKPLIELGAGCRLRFAGSLAADLNVTAHNLVFVESTPGFQSDVELRGALLAYRDSDPRTRLGRTYIGFGPSVDLCGGIFRCHNNHICGQSLPHNMEEYRGNVLIGCESFTCDGAMKFGQLVISFPQYYTVSLIMGHQF